MNGLEVLSRLKSNSNAKDIPIVALSEYSMRRDKERFLEAGCSGYISKPIDISGFFKNIKSFMNKTDN